MIKITHNSGYIILKRSGSKVDMIPKDSVRFGAEGDYITISTKSSVNNKSLPHTYRFKYKDVFVPATADIGALLVLLQSYAVSKVETNTDSLVTNIASLVDMNLVGSPDNLPLYSTSRYFSNTRLVTDEDSIAYHLSVISSLGALQYVQIHEANPIITITNIVDDGAGGVNMTCAAAHGIVAGANMIIQDVLGAVEANTPLTAIAVTRVDDVTLNIAVLVVTAYVSGGMLSEEVVDTTVPVLTLPVGDNLFHSFGNGRQFVNGLYICNSTDVEEKVVGAADCYFDIAYYPTI